jgi:hypothetical protein
MYQFPTDLRSGQKRCNHPQNVRVALGRIIESRGVNESHTPTVELEWLRDLYNTGTGLESSPDTQLGVAC